MSDWRSGDINVSVGGGQEIGVNVSSGGLDTLGRRAFTVGVGEGSAVTIAGDYRKMRNLPSINGVTIIGELSLEDIGLKAIYYDKTANYDEEIVSQEGSLYIYSDYLDYVDDEGVRTIIPGIRVGDGKTKLGDLPFIGGSSGSGTTNYNALRNKPSINGVVLEGDVDLDDLSLKAIYGLTKSVYESEYTLIPLKDDIFIIGDYEAHTSESGDTSYTPAIVIGDGVHQLADLRPMVGYDAEKAKEDFLNYLVGMNVLVSEEDRTRWNRKRLKVIIDPVDNECLRFFYD